MIRIGLGSDIHEFVINRPLILGGVSIPYEKGLIGHSDADALLHAIIDALLGAANKGDIGCLFPDNDHKWKDANSLTLLSDTWELIEKDGWSIENIDCSILLERPKIAPYISEMKNKISSVLKISPDQCGIKATTSEGLGFVGRGEGIFTQAVVLLTKSCSI